MNNERKFYVNTPMGKLVVYAKHDEDTPDGFPGIHVDLERNFGNDTCEHPVCTIEYDSEEHRLQIVPFTAELDAPGNVIVYNTLAARQWQTYCDYLASWAFTHKDPGFAGCCPVCFDEFVECEFKEIEGRK